MADQKKPELSIILACYGQPLMMAKQLETWEMYPRELLDRVEFIVVDDHGDPPFTEESTRFDLRIYRVLKDIPWNQMGARNLGQKKAKAPWRLMLDPDMVLPTASLSTILGRIHGRRPGIHFKPFLRHLSDPLRIDHGSPNLHVTHGKDFWAAGGYNEDFAGHKGYSDVVLHRTLAAMSKRVLWNDVWLDFYAPRHIADAEVVSIDRCIKHNTKLFEAAVNFAGKNSWKLYAQGIKRHVRFDWERVR